MENVNSLGVGALGYHTTGTFAKHTQRFLGLCEVNNTRSWFP